MRIFYAAPTTAHQSALPESRLWHVNLYLPLQDLGHELVAFDYDFTRANEHLDPELHAEYIAANRPRFSEELVRQVERAHRERSLDLFFSYFYSSYVEPEAIRAIRELGIVAVNWYCNGSYQFDLVAEIAPAYDFCLVPERFRLDDYRRVGANPLYCQEAANPNVYRPYDVPRELDVTFVGQKYGDRPQLLRALLDAGVDVRAWGPNWERPLYRPSLRDRAAAVVGGRPQPQALADLPPARCGPPLPDEDYVQMFSRSKISLGFSALLEPPADGAPPRQVRLRDFEAPMSGAFYLVEAFDELAEFFEPGREVVFFEGEDELVEKARWYLAHENERERVRLAGLRRARAEHTWHERFRTAFAQIGLA